MAAIVVQLAASNAIQLEPDGRVLLNTTTGGREFPDEATFRSWVRDNAADPQSPACQDATLAILAGHLLAQDPLLDSLSTWNGKKATLDVEQAVPTNVLKFQ